MPSTKYREPCALNNVGSSIMAVSSCSSVVCLSQCLSQWQKHDCQNDCNNDCNNDCQKSIKSHKVLS